MTEINHKIIDGLLIYCVTKYNCTLHTASRPTSAVEDHFKAALECFHYVMFHMTDEFVSVNGRTIHMYR